MRFKWSTFIIVILLSIPAIGRGQNPLRIDNDVLAQSGGIDASAVDVSSTQLNYRMCNGIFDMQALLKINIIGTGPNQIPAGSTITDATLRLKAAVGGDGRLYRAIEAWDASPTWGELGDVSASSDSVGVGLSTGQSLPFDVTAHVQAWANGTLNRGWVIKGAIDDCQAARIQNESAPSTDRPHLTVFYIPPSSSSGALPRVNGVSAGSTVSTNPTHGFPRGSGAQIQTIPVADINWLEIRFTEDVTNVDVIDLELESAITGLEPSVAASFRFVAGSLRFTLANTITAPDQIIVKVRGIGDSDGNELDGEWTNPMSLMDTGTSIVSGNGVEGGELRFYVTILPGDGNRDNWVSQSDMDLVLLNWGQTVGPIDAWTRGDTNGNYKVDQADLDHVLLYWGTDFRNWPAGGAGSQGAMAGPALTDSTTGVMLTTPDQQRLSALVALDTFLQSYGWTGVDQAVNSEDPSLATADEVTWGAFMDSLASALDKHHGVDTP